MKEIAETVQIVTGLALWVIVLLPGITGEVESRGGLNGFQALDVRGSSNHHPD